MGFVRSFLGEKYIEINAGSNKQVYFVDDLLVDVTKPKEVKTKMRGYDYTGKKAYCFYSIILKNGEFYFAPCAHTEVAEFLKNNGKDIDGAIRTTIEGEVITFSPLWERRERSCKMIEISPEQAESINYFLGAVNAISSVKKQDIALSLEKAEGFGWNFRCLKREMFDLKLAKRNLFNFEDAFFDDFDAGEFYDRIVCEYRTLQCEESER